MGRGRFYRYGNRGPRKRAARKSRVILGATVIWCALTVLFALWDGDVTGYDSLEFSPSSIGGAKFGLCRSASQQNCVIDGDTIRLGGVKIRLADIDTPEISSPKCDYEAALGHKAKRRLLELMNAGPIEIVSIGGPEVDRYGRQLRIIKREGRSIAETLVAEGLARRWSGARRSWCDDAAQRGRGMKSGETG
jgi:endonuclease YncB( thermonuclease family)